MALDDDPEIHESYEKRVVDRRAADEALDAYYAKHDGKERDNDRELEKVTELEAQDLDSDEEDDDVDAAERALNLEAFDSPLREWIAEERTRREISRRFKKFLMNYYVGIEDVTRWQKRHGDDLPLPQGLKRAPSVYLPLIR